MVHPLLTVVHPPPHRYADNIARVYAHAIAMVVTMLASLRLFHAHVTPQVRAAYTALLPAAPSS